MISNVTKKSIKKVVKEQGSIDANNINIPSKNPPVVQFEN